MPITLYVRCGRLGGTASLQETLADFSGRHPEGTQPRSRAEKSFLGEAPREYPASPYPSIPALNLSLKDDIMREQQRVRCEERAMAGSNGQRSATVADNRKARHDYFIDETYEAGLALTGSEIKSVR